MNISKLILWRRFPEFLIILAVTFIIYVVIQYYRRHNILLGFILFFITIGFFSWYECFRWEPLQPLTLEFRTSFAGARYRTDNNKKVIPEDYTWYPISPQIENNGSFYQKVINRYIDNGGTFDFNQYTYLITCGFTMEALYRLPDWDQSECVAVHGYDCLPDEALIYRIPLNHILPGEDRTDKTYYVFL